MGSNARREISAVDWPGCRRRRALWQSYLRIGLQFAVPKRKRRYRRPQRSLWPTSVSDDQALPPLWRVSGWRSTHQPKQWNLRLRYFVCQWRRWRTGLPSLRPRNRARTAGLDQYTLLRRGPEWRALLNRRRGALLAYVSRLKSSCHLERSERPHVLEPLCMRSFASRRMTIDKREASADRAPS